MSVSKLEGANVKITLGGVEVGTGVGDLRNDTDAFVRAVMRDDSRAGKACGGGGAGFDSRALIAIALDPNDGLALLPFFSILPPQDLP